MAEFNSCARSEVTPPSPSPAWEPVDVFGGVESIEVLLSETDEILDSQARARAVGSAMLTMFREQALANDELLSLVGVAEELGLSKQRIFQLKAAHNFPTPFSILGGHVSIWLRGDIVNWQQRRGTPRA
jgi:predicted DNA-binding transcriptional regulator AlpA